MTDTMYSMLSALRGAGYDPKEGGGVLAELSAYDAVLAPLTAAADRLLQNLFVETAEEVMLYRWEELFCPQLPETTAENRRAMLLHRGSVTQEDISCEVLTEHLPAACLRGRVQEQPDGTLLVQAEELFGATEEQAEHFLSLYLPAHLEFTLQTV